MADIGRAGSVQVSKIPVCRAKGLRQGSEDYLVTTRTMPQIGMLGDSMVGFGRPGRNEIQTSLLDNRSERLACVYDYAMAPQSQTLSELHIRVNVSA